MSGQTISLRSVSKWFGSVVAVNDVSLDVYPGITGLLGPNGAGKTTVLHMIAGLTSPSEGEVEVLGGSARVDPGLYGRLGMMSEHEAGVRVLHRSPLCGARRAALRPGPDRTRGRPGHPQGWGSRTRSTAPWEGTRAGCASG